jgi:hypothetical protein
MVVSAEIVHLVVDAGSARSIGGRWQMVVWESGGSWFATGMVRVHFLIVDAGRVVQDPLVADGRWWCGREWELLC